MCCVDMLISVDMFQTFRLFICYLCYQLHENKSKELQS